jgi:hypothetical protein
VKRIADDQPHTGERRVQPVQRRLPLLEVVQVDPAVVLAVGADHGGGCGPVRVLEAGLVEDDALEPADDVAALGQQVLGLVVEVDRVTAARDLREEVPVCLRDLDHVVDPGVVLVAHLGEAEVGALAGVSGHDVVDDRAAVRRRDLAHLTELVLGAERLVELRADPVEVAVHTRCGLPAPDAAGPLDRPGVDRGDPDGLERGPELRVAQGAEERPVRLGDDGDRVCGEPHRGLLDGRARVGVRERVLPHAALAGEQLRERLRVAQHRLFDQPLDVLGVVAGGRAVTRAAALPRPHAQPGPGPEPGGSRGIELLVVVELLGLDVGLTVLCGDAVADRMGRRPGNLVGLDLDVLDVGHGETLLLHWKGRKKGAVLLSRHAAASSSPPGRRVPNLHKLRMGHSGTAHGRGPWNRHTEPQTGRLGTGRGGHDDGGDTGPAAGDGD